MALSKIETQALDVGQIGGRRNLIINGAMQVAQRGVETTGVTTPTYYSVDRMKFDIASCGTHTIRQSTDAPDGFSTSYEIEVTTAETNPTTTDKLAMQYLFEGQDLQHLKYGSASAQNITLSFWVKTNKTGTYSNEIIQTDNNNRHYSFNYTVNSADTWEYKTITISGDSSGLIDNGTGLGLVLKFWLDGGDSWTSGTYTADQWQARTNANVISSSSPHLADTIGNTWYITGVQLEVGSVATPFEHRSYGEEMVLCSRYYATSFKTKAPQNGTVFTSNDDHYYQPAWQHSGGSGVVGSRVYFITEMRAIPTITFYQNAGVSDTAGQFGFYNGSTWGRSTSINAHLNNRNGFNPNLSGTGAASHSNNWLISGGWAAEAEL